MQNAAHEIAGPSQDWLSRYYDSKEAAYFVGARADFIAELPDDPEARILEIGCGSGETGQLAINAGKAGHYAGIDISPAAAARARTFLSEVLTGNVDHMELPWATGSFDAVILSEVLEHLVDPWAVLKRVAAVTRPGGLVLASSPNVSHYAVLAQLFRGRFDLAESGTMDRTHMRWFTPATYAEMFEKAGFSVDIVKPLTPFAPRTRFLSAVTGGRFDHLFMRQIWLKAHKH
jgi:2-polyprenyl-3-methyl-5-hydroxy-6-metoxy-1,4-benzoquinol methylase